MPRGPQLLTCESSLPPQGLSPGVSRARDPGTSEASIVAMLEGVRQCLARHVSIIPCQGDTGNEPGGSARPRPRPCSKPCLASPCIFCPPPAGGPSCQIKDLTQEWGFEAVKTARVHRWAPQPWRRTVDRARGTARPPRGSARDRLTAPPPRRESASIPGTPPPALAGAPH